MKDKDIDIRYISNLTKLGLWDHASIYLGRTLYIKRGISIGNYRPFYINWNQLFADGINYSGYWL